MPEFALAALPLLVLLAALLLGRYPGCDTILAIADRLRSRPAEARGRGSRSRRPHRPRSFAAAGGLLIGLGHAQRPPPLAR